MKRISLVLLCIFFLLSSGVKAAERSCYKLGKGAMGFISVYNANELINLTHSKDNIAAEYFQDLVTQKLAFQTNKDLIVYKFDHFSAMNNINIFRIKLQNDTSVEFIDTTSGIISNIKLPSGSTLGWVFGLDLKKSKCK
jgi:hypothetical protein